MGSLGISEQIMLLLFIAIPAYLIYAVTRVKKSDEIKYLNLERCIALLKALGLVALIITIPVFVIAGGLGLFYVAGIALLSALIFYASAEFLRVIIDVEKNTRQQQFNNQEAITLLKEIRDRLNPNPLQQSSTTNIDDDI